MFIKKRQTTMTEDYCIRQTADDLQVKVETTSFKNIK